MREQFIACWTILRKEVLRLAEVWKSTLMAPIISTALYFIVFGAFIGSRIGEVKGLSYTQFIIPGLVMMPAITGSYMQGAFSVFLQRFQRSIEDILITPTRPWAFLAGFALSGVARGMIISVLVWVVSLFFAPLRIYSVAAILTFMILTSLCFSLVGFAAALHAKTFDDNSIIPTFVLQPMIFLGGVFYSIDSLPAFWQMVSRANPILYMVNGFRYGFYGVSDVSVWTGIALLSLFVLIAGGYDLYLIKKGVGLRT